VDATNLKLKAADQQKSKLTQEVQILIKEVEVHQVTIKEINLKLSDREKRSEELAIKLREMTNLFEKADHDNKVRAQDIVRLGNELDRAKMDNDLLHRDNGKLSDESRCRFFNLCRFGGYFRTCFCSRLMDRISS
jgi:hypothetical protein